MESPLPRTQSAAKPGRLLYTAITILCQCAFVKAQNPLSDLGGWPSGAATLLGGAYTAIYNLGQSNFDVLPPICLSALWHRIPYAKKFLRSGRIGSNFTGLVLESGQHAFGTHRLEWDTVIFSRPITSGPQTSSHSAQQSSGGTGNTTQITDRFNISSESAVDKTKVILSITVKGINFAHLEHATQILFGDNNLTTDLHLFLRKWHGFMMYREEQGMWVGKSPTEQELLPCVDDLAKCMLHQQRSECERLSRPLKDLKMQFLYKSPLLNNGELGACSWWDDTYIDGRELALLLAFEKVLTDGGAHKELNPLVPCLQLWMLGGVGPVDNLHITLPTTEAFRISQLDGSGLTLKYELELQQGPYHIDGLVAPSVAYPWIFTFWRIVWLMNTICAVVMVFFVTLASNATPSLATALALSFAVPFSNDYSWHDAGCPPSWNGRIRVRWGEESGFACGIFAGLYGLKPGRTGTSYTRCGILLVTSWLTWMWKRELRHILGFGEEQEISGWVKWVAIFIFTIAVATAWVHAIGLNKIGQRNSALLIWANSLGIVGVAVLFGWRIVHGQETWWLALLFSEGGVTLLGTLFPAFVMVGIAPQNGALVLWSKFVWVFLVLMSCFNG